MSFIFNPYQPLLVPPVAVGQGDAESSVNAQPLNSYLYFISFFGSKEATTPGVFIPLKKIQFASIPSPQHSAFLAPLWVSPKEHPSSRFGGQKIHPSRPKDVPQEVEGQKLILSRRKCLRTVAHTRRLKDLLW